MDSFNSSVVGSRGCFIVIEGFEGSGKSRLVELITDGLQNRGFFPVVTKQPGGTSMGDALAGVLKDKRHSTTGEVVSTLAETYLLAAARVLSFDNVITPAVVNKKIVISDRHDMSTLALQGAIDESIVRISKRPDLTIFINAPFDICLTRMTKRGDECRMEAKGLEFLSTVYDRYQNNIDDRTINGRVCYVDSTSFEGAVYEQDVNTAIDKIIEVFNDTISQGKN